METLKNYINSPRLSRKKLEPAAGDTGQCNVPSSVPKTFGVSLADLMKRAPPKAIVPQVVSRLCEYIYKHGLDNVGLFRVSGSVRVVERLRMQIELMGDVDLEKENDVPATAGLLKVFLRDLPDTLIPKQNTTHLFSLVQDTRLSREELLQSIKLALGDLPDVNYNLLKYIASLLSVVAYHEYDNKMSAYSLALMFGPNVFKYELTSDIRGLKDMESSKEVMQLFIAEYNSLFALEDEPSPRIVWEKLNKKKSPPPRPPPPKVQSLPSFSTPCAETVTASLTTSASSTALDYRPVPSPRKIKSSYDSSSGSEFEGRQTPTFSLHSSIPVFSPRDFDLARAHSPFALESETHSIIESPMITARTQEFVERTIGETISEHIFGTMDFNENSGSQSPRTKTDESDDNGNLDDLPVTRSILSPPGVLEKRSWHITARPRTFHMLEDASPENDREDFDGVERSNILTAHKKPTGPPRRIPSRKHRRSWEADQSSQGTLSSSHNQLDPPPNNVIQVHHLNRSLNHSQGGRDKENEEYEEERQRTGDASPTIKPKTMRRNENKALLPQSLSLQNTQESFPSQPSPTSNGSGLLDRSPSVGIKLFIPPLDLTTLHEHIDGVEPIPLSKERSDPQIWVKTNTLMGPPDHNVAIISPRSNKLKNWSEPDPAIAVVYEAPMSPSAYCSSGLFRVSMNTDIPPSPPIQQDLYKKHGDEDGSYRLRQITKKIQGLKKKIKAFEENFEKEYGYRPTQGEKAGQPDIKRYMNELSKARKDLKRLKEETEKGNRSRHNSGASSSGVDQAPPPAVPSVSTTLEYIEKCLSDKRQESGRPEAVGLMSRDQVQEEKLAVQRALLHFEGIHGRPTTKEEKDIMRPLYDRYRAIKRMLAKPMSPRNSLELQTVPEDQMMEIPQQSFNRPIHVRVPTGFTEDEESGTPDPGTLEFGLVTRDYNVMRDFELPSFHGRATDKGLQQAGGGGGLEVGADANLHQLSLMELHVQIEDSKKMKKRLRRILREFEESFLLKSGRKVQKEDRYPLQTEYSDYKKVKARLRLLEALVLKQHE